MYPPPLLTAEVVTGARLLCVPVHHQHHNNLLCVVLGIEHGALYVLESTLLSLPQCVLLEGQQQSNIGLDPKVKLPSGCVTLECYGLVEVDGL